MRPLAILVICCCVLGAGEAAVPAVDSAAGQVAVSPGTKALPGADEALTTLAAAAARGGCSDGGWTLRHGLLTGWQLRRSDAIVCSAGILRREAPPTEDAAERQAALAQARDLAMAAIDPALPAVGAEAVRALLRRLDGGERTIDGLAAADARRLAASPWLDGLVASEAAVALRAALATASHQLIERFSDGDHRLERHGDAYGDEVWIWRTPAATAYAMAVPGPTYRGHVAMTLVVILPPGADPWRDAGRASAARLHWGEVEVARWDGAHVTAADDWKAWLVPWGSELEPLWPAPHIALSAPDGRVLRLLVGSAALDAPGDGGDAGFIARAAAILDTPALLPLLGDTFFTYAFDSPDPSHARLIGDAQRHGDIHQTTERTLATTVGGRFRGDCDDLAELYVAVLGAQQRLAHVMHVPGHAAAGWLERSGKSWRMHVLQSGPARCFEADTGGAAVAAAYDGLAEDEPGTTRADQITVLLRFAGENTRSRWRLSWRIYADAAYARTMIAVQRDWHFRTYHRGVEAMLALIAAGDADPANHSELSGLYRRIGDWPNSIERHRLAAAARGSEPTLDDRLDELRLQVLGRMHEQVRSAVLSIARQIGKEGKKDELRAIELASELIGMLDGPAYAALRQDLSKRLIQPWFDRATPVVRTWLSDRFDAGTWGSDRYCSVFRQAGYILASERVAPWSSAAQDGRAPPADFDAQRFLGWWYDEISALPFSARADPAESVTSAASWLSLRIGHQRMAALVASARPPHAWDGTAVSFSGLLGASRVASWAAVSVPWIAHDMSRAVMTPAGAARTAAVTGLLAQLDTARAFCASHGLVDAETEAAVARTRLLAALVEGERQLLDSCLSGIATRADRRELETAAGTIGSWAGHMTPERFSLAVARWFALVDQRPFALEIPWRALHATRWDAAITAARAAAQRYPDDAELVAEAERIAALAESRRSTVPEDMPGESMWVP